jgi:hypothetical protein
MSSRRTCSSLLITIALLCTASVAGATVVVPLTLGEQVARADLIVRARVVAQRSAYVPARGAIMTWTTLEPTEWIVGQPSPSALLVRQLGGHADGMIQSIPGDGHLAPGDDVIVFLERDPVEHQTVFLLALAQSVWFVEGDRARRDLSELGFAILGAQGMRTEEPAPEAAVDRAQLVRDIRALAGAR